MSDCIKCGMSTGDMAIGCDKCDSWTHYSCALLSTAEVERIINYYCDECEDDVYLTTWRRERGSVSKRMMKEKEYFTVNAIRGHRERNGKREFLVEWEDLDPGTKKNAKSWEPEEHLDGSIDSLQNYCRRKNIALSSIIGLLGADVTSNEKTSRSNWATMDAILSRMSMRRKWLKIKSDLEILQWSKPGEKDCLYFLDLNFHCYVLLYDHQLKAAYIADGDNVFRTVQEIADEVRKVTKIRLISIAFDKQLKIDHCASSAILIGLELLRMHSKGIRLKKITCTKSLREKVTKSFHRNESLPVKLLSLRKRHENLTCNLCGKSYKPTKGRNFNVHISRCREKQT